MSSRKTTYSKKEGNRQEDAEFFNSLLINYKLSNGPKPTIDDPEKKKMTPQQLQFTTYSNIIGRPQHSQLSTNFSSKHSKQIYPRPKIYGDTKAKNKMFIRAGSEFLFSALGGDSVGDDLDMNSITDMGLQNLEGTKLSQKIRPETVKAQINKFQPSNALSEINSPGRIRPTTAVGLNFKKKLAQSKQAEEININETGKMRNEIKFRPSSAIRPINGGLRSATLLGKKANQNDVSDSSCDSPNQEKVKIKIVETNQTTLKKGQKERVKTRVNKVLRHRIHNRFVVQADYQKRGLSQEPATKPEVLSGNMEQFVKRKNSNLIQHFTRHFGEIDQSKKQLKPDPSQLKVTPQQNQLISETITDVNVDKEPPKIGNFFQSLSKPQNRQAGNTEKNQSRSSSSMSNKIEVNIQRQQHQFQIKIHTEESANYAQSGKKNAQKLPSKLISNINSMADIEENLNQQNSNNFESHGNLQAFTFFDKKQHELEVKNRKRGYINQPSIAESRTPRSNRSSSQGLKPGFGSSRNFTKDPGNFSEAVKKQKKLTWDDEEDNENTESREQTLETERRLDDNPIKFINEKIVYFDEMKLFLDQKVGKCLNPEDEIIEEQMREHQQRVSNIKSKFSGEYRYCEAMAFDEQVSFQPQFVEPRDPIWDQEVKKRPPSPKQAFQLDKLEDYIDKSKKENNSTQVLTHFELDFLNRQYGLKELEQEIDIDRVDQILRRQFFFVKFSSAIRHRIIRNSQLNYYPKGHVVFQQGDFGDKMYVIVKGSVNVVINNPDPFTGEHRPRIVAWMNDGTSFGSYSMLSGEDRGMKKTVATQITMLTKTIKDRENYLKQGVIYGQKIDLNHKNPILMDKEVKLGVGEVKAIERTRRAASIIVTQDAHLLELSREFYQEIILMTIKDEYEKKMRLISEINFLRNHTIMDLMPVVNFFKKKIYKLGQGIMQQGDLIDELYVVAKGRCKVVDVSIRSRIAEPCPFVRGLTSDLRALKLGPQNLGKIWFSFVMHEDTKIEGGKRDDLGFQKVKKIEEEERMKIQRENERLRNERRKTKGKLEEDDVREFSYMDEPELTKNDPQQNYYKDHCFIKYLERGSVFGLRSLKRYTLERTKDGFKTNDSYQKYAQLSIFAETAQVVVYSFSSDNFKYLTEDIKKTLIEAIDSNPDFDEYRKEKLQPHDRRSAQIDEKQGSDQTNQVIKLKEFSDKWDHYKNNLFLEVMKEQFDIRGKDNFKRYKKMPT